MSNNKKGFTLVELLAVMVIISVLLLLALPAVTRQIQLARKKTFAEDAHTIASAVKDDVLMGDKVFSSANRLFYNKSDIDGLLDKKLRKSPFGGTYEIANVEVQVNKDSEGKRSYTMRVCLVDSDGNGFGYSSVDNLDAESIGIGTVSSDCKPQFEATSVVQTNNDNSPNYIPTNVTPPDNSQVPDDQEITEFRFVGSNLDVKKNYVYFNCSDTSNQNDSTCDLFRIMGEFTVDNGSGVFENRLKLVDVSEIKAPAPNAGKWDVNGSNNWVNSSLNEYLNGPYLNRINDKYRSVMAPAKYYLGGYTSANITRSQMYNYERKTSNDDGTYYHPYNESDTSWVGIVGLMYASDFGYATKNDACESVKLSNYDTDESVNGCGNNWVWKLDIEDLQPSPYWLITQVSSTSNDAYYVDNTGMAKSVSVFGSNHPAHPVFYLNATAEIVGGDGTRSNPYRLFK